MQRLGVPLKVAYGAGAMAVSADPDNTGVSYDIREFESAVFLNTGNHGGLENHWLRMRFSGARDAEILGTRVEVRPAASPKLFAIRGIYSNHSYKSSSALEAHFGLGTLDTVDLVIHQPGGRKTELKNLAVDRYIDIDLATGAVTDLPVSKKRGLAAVAADAAVVAVEN
jgi:hypothetical protein